MSTSDRHYDPAVDPPGSRPTDRSLPIGRRTRPGPFLVALAVVFLIGIALVAFGSLRLGQSTARIDSNPSAVPPTSNLLPDKNSENSSGIANGSSEPSPSGEKGGPGPASVP
jgi:hypothetical protein